MTAESKTGPNSNTQPTVEQAEKMKLGLAVSQTSYAINNGGGLEIGMPLRFIDDATLMNASGAKALNLNIPDGYTVLGVYRNIGSGKDAFAAFNKSERKFVVGFAGTNGFGNDGPDTKEDLSYLGTRHAAELMSSLQFRSDFKDAAESIGGVENIKDFLIAGQSLGGGIAPVFGMMAVYGNPKSADPLAGAGLGLRPGQVSTVSANGFGTAYSFQLAGFAEQDIKTFNTESEQLSLVVRNTVTGATDLVSQTGGGRGGLMFELEVADETSLGGLHRFNYGIAEALARVDNDLTQLKPITVPPLSHETISQNFYWLGDKLALANNTLSLSWGGYVSVLFSRPGESAAGISVGLQNYLGMSKGVSDALGMAGEFLLRGLPMANVAHAARLLFGSYLLGQTIGSGTSAEIKFPDLQTGWNRINLTPKESQAHAEGWRFVLDTNPTTGFKILRTGNGNTQEFHPDGTIVYAHQQFGMGVFKKDGSGTLHLTDTDPKTGEIVTSRVSFAAGTQIDLVADGWRTTREPKDLNGSVEISYYRGIQVSVMTGNWQEVEREGETKRVFGQSAVSHFTLPTDIPAPDADFSWTVSRTVLANGHILEIQRDGDRRVIEVVREERLSETTMRITKRNAEDKPVETRVITKFVVDGETFTLDDITLHTSQTRILTTTDSRGIIKKTEPISVDAAPVQMTQQARDMLYADVADFLTALRQKDKAGIMLSSARLMLDYARTQGMVTLQYDTMVGDTSGALALVSALRALGSDDAMAQIGGGVGLLNSTNYFAGRLAANGTGYLSATQTAALSTVGAVLSIANLANLGKMLDNGQIGSASASLISAVNAIGYLTKGSSLMGAGALVAINPIVMVVFAFGLDKLFGEDPPPPPPQGLATLIRQADGTLGFRLTEHNALGAKILNREMAQLLPKLEAQLAQANKNITDPEHAFRLIASRMPSVRISAWPSQKGNGVDNYFFVLEQSDPMKDDANLIGVARQDLVRLYAETLLLPEALAQQWEIDHLRHKFGSDEAHWHTEGEWLRGRSPVEKQRSLLQQEVERSVNEWKASSKILLALKAWGVSTEQIGNLTLQVQGQQHRLQIQEASRLRMEAAQAAAEAFALAHPTDPRDAARATAEQERAFFSNSSRSQQAQSIVSLQWLNVIAVDLGDDGVTLNDLPSRVGTDLDSLRVQGVARFDVDGDGFLEATQWIAPSEAILGIDRSGNGLPDNGSELFASGDTPFDQHGLASLAYFDANADGQITREDPVFAQLRLWIDLDGDGSAGSLEVYNLDMQSAASKQSGRIHDKLAAIAVTGIDLATSTLRFADGSSAPLVNTALLAHTKGVQVGMDERTGNLNVLHETGLRENFITLKEDMAALEALLSKSLSGTRRTELEALARRYGLNPAAPEFSDIVQSLRASGEALGQQDTVIYFGDDAVWVDPQVRERLEQMRISFRKLGDPAGADITGDSQLARLGQPLGTQAVSDTQPFNDRWVASRTLAAHDIISEHAATPSQPAGGDAQSEQAILPSDVYSLMQVVKGAQRGGPLSSAVTEQAVVISDPDLPGSAPETIQIFSTAQPVSRLAAAQLLAHEDSIVTFSFFQLEQEAQHLLDATDPGARVQLVGIRSASHGKVQVDDEAGRLSFQPQADFVGEAGFTYVLVDQNGQTLERSVKVSLLEVNDAPRLAGERIYAKEDIPLLIDSATLLANDSDIEGDSLSITGIGRVGLGRAELLGNGQIHYTPPSDQYGITDTLEYIVQDSRGASAIGKISIWLDAVDDAPSVVSERIINAREDQTVRIASRLLLWNDFDLDTDARVGSAPLRITAVGSAEHGRVSLSSSGEIVFVPDTHYNGDAAFSYTVMDESGLSTTGRAHMRIDPVNDAPLVADEHISSDEDERLVIDPALLLLNDIDIDIERGEKQTLSVVAVDAASGGMVQMQGGLIVFVPDANFHGQAGFRYTVSDGAGGYGQGHVDITLAAVNDAPDLPQLRFSAAEDTILRIPVAQLLAGVTDVDGDSPVFHLTGFGNATGGSVEQIGNELVFRPEADFFGAAAFEVTIADQQGASTTGIVAVDVNNINDAPTFMTGSRLAPTGEEDQEIRISESALARMFWDADGDAIQIAPEELVALNAGDSVQFDAVRRELVFRAAPNAYGTRQLSFAMTDGQALSQVQTLSITLRAVNDAPVVNAVGFQMLEDGGQTNPNLTAWSYLSHEVLLSGATDVDDAVLNVVSVAAGRTAGSTQADQLVQVVNDPEQKRVAIMAPLNYNGAIEFSFTVQDAMGAATTQKAYGSVVAVNDAPSLKVQKSDKGSFSITLLGRVISIERWQINAWDPDVNESVKLAIERNPLRGKVSLGKSLSTPDPASGLDVEAAVTIIINMSGNATSAEAVWLSATDAAGASSLINIGFTGRYHNDPIVIDLDSDGLRFINIADSAVTFDTEGDGVQRRSAWIAPSEAILAWDHDQNGVINRLDEIAFWSHINPRDPERSDLQSLQHAVFDHNQDGIFNASDAKWQQFMLWRDLNSNGVSDAGELQTMEQAGVKQLFLAANVLNRAEGPDVRVRGYTRVEMTDGRLLQAADVWLGLESDIPAEGATPDPVAQQATLLAADQLQRLLAQLATTPTGSKHAPLLVGHIPTQFADEGHGFQLDIAPNLFLDPDTGDKLRFTATLADGSALPDWLSFDAATLRFAGQPTQNDAGSLQIALTASDSEQSHTTTWFKLITSEMNRAPQVQQVPKPISWAPGTNNFTQLPTDLFIDPNKEDPIFIAARLADGRALPDWLVFDPVALTLSGNPTAAQLVTPLRLVFVATDLGGLSTLTSTSLTASLPDAQYNYQLTGSDSAEQLSGEAGNDTLTGLGGNDTLTGGAGDDQYVFGPKWGHDRIIEEGGETSEHNSIHFLDGISLEDLAFSRDLHALHVHTRQSSPFHDSGSSITIPDFYRNDGWLPIQSLHFSSGEMLTGLDTLDPVFEGTLTDGADFFTGSKTGNNRINGGDGNDTIHGQSAHDSLSGGQGDDYLAGHDGDDVLDGGIGNDTLDGGSGDDTYHFAPGGGYDFVTDSSGYDTLQFDGVSDFTALTFQRTGLDLLAGFNHTADRITVKNFYLEYGEITHGTSIDSFRLANGSMLSAGAVGTLVASAMSTAGTASGGFPR